MDQPLDIDDRSPGERMADGRRAGYARVRGLVEERRSDYLARLWMTFILLIVAAEIYGALSFPSRAYPGGGAWTKATLLAQSGGPTVAFGCMVGLALAAVFEGPAARIASRLAVVGGAWTVLAGVLGIAVAIHGDATGLLFWTKASAAGFAIGGTGLGLVVLLLARQVAPAAPA